MFNATGTLEKCILTCFNSFDFFEYLQHLAMLRNWQLFAAFVSESVRAQIDVKCLDVDKSHCASGTPTVLKFHISI